MDCMMHLMDVALHAQMGVLMSLTRPRVLLALTCTGWPDHERVPPGPPAGQDAGGFPQLQVPGSCQLQQNIRQQQQLHCHYHCHCHCCPGWLHAPVISAGFVLDRPCPSKLQCPLQLFFPLP